MLNIKEQGLPDLHGCHPAFRCRKKTKTFKTCGLFFGPKLTVQGFEYLTAYCSYPASAMCKNTSHKKRNRDHTIDKPFVVRI